MKELLEKFFGLFSEGLDKLEEDNKEEAIKKFKEASEMSADLTKKSESKEEVDLEKLFNSDEWKEALQKAYASLNISDSNFQDLLAQLTEAQDNLKELKKEKETDDKLVSKTLDSILDRLEKVETAKVSKIED